VRGWCVLAIALAGCFQPSPPRGLACETECPNGETCVDGLCHPEGYTAPDADPVDAPVDGVLAPDANLDPDNDGILTPDDNCPSVTNQNQHDEDGDKFGDACDPCPMLFGGDEDTDSDGVGDACDPQPAVAKQHWVVFEPFTSASTMWNYPTTGVVANDVMTLTGQTAQLKIGAKSARIFVGGTITNVSSSATSHQFGIWPDSTTSTNQYYFEAFDKTEGPENGFRLMAFDSVASNYIKLDEVLYVPPLPNGAFAVQYDYSSVQQNVSATGKFGSQTFTISSGAAMDLAIPEATSISFGAYSAKATIQYVAVLESVP
jgi:hypothetical protein